MLCHLIVGNTGCQLRCRPLTSTAAQRVKYPRRNGAERLGLNKQRFQRLGASGSSRKSFTVLGYAFFASKSTDNGWGGSF